MSSSFASLYISLFKHTICLTQQYPTALPHRHNCNTARICPSARFALGQGEGLWPGEEVVLCQMSAQYNGSLGKGETLPELPCAQDQQLEVGETCSNHHPGSSSCCSCPHREVHKDQHSRTLPDHNRDTGQGGLGR